MFNSLQTLVLCKQTEVEKMENQNIEFDKCLEKVSEWLSRQKSARQTETRFYKFLRYSNASLPELFDMKPKEAENMIEDTQIAMQKDGIMDNSILTYVASIKRFFKKVRRMDLDFDLFAQQTKAKGYHNFSNGDLGKIYAQANAQYKALFSLASSCGFGISDILKLDKHLIEQHIKSARQNKKQFCFIEQTRKKTNAESLLVINPLAMESLENWIRQNPKEKLFNLREDAVNNMLKKLCDRSGIILKGKVKFHKIRAWVISSLIKAGFQTQQWKYLVGKSVPISDSTYMELKEGIEEKYPLLYAKYLCITAQSHEVKTKDKEIEALKQALKSVETENATFKTRIDNMQNDLTQDRALSENIIKRLTLLELRDKKNSISKELNHR